MIDTSIKGKCKLYAPTSLSLRSSIKDNASFVSCLRISNTSVTSCSPFAADPQNQHRPEQAAVAPRAFALTIFSPRLNYLFRPVSACNEFSNLS